MFDLYQLAINSSFFLGLDLLDLYTEWCENGL